MVSSKRSVRWVALWKRSLGIRHGMTRDNPRAVRPQHRQLTGQLEVGQHAQPIRPMGDQDFGATIGAQQGPAHEQPQIGKWRVAHQLRQCQLEPRQSATGQLALDDLADGFDFRQLGHSSSGAPPTGRNPGRLTTSRSSAAGT